MASLKDIRNRMGSVKSTKKITSAMKMIAAAKLRRAQNKVAASLPYADMMSDMIKSLKDRAVEGEQLPTLLTGTGEDKYHVYVVITSDRGLCGSFNASVCRYALRMIQKLDDGKRDFKIVCIGRKARDFFHSSKFRDHILETYLNRNRPSFMYADRIGERILEEFNQGKMDFCTVVYNKFISAISQKLTSHQIMPYSPLDNESHEKPEQIHDAGIHAIYDYEPSANAVLNALLPQNFSVQLYRAMLENAASEHGARMTAMDSATRNADDMLKNLNLVYNRTRQALVTRELIEIISGAEAL
ncbi:MAG: F0F1 ATP synthase subunit gamma [Alphaproteobacteria bacterium]